MRKPISAVCFVFILVVLGQSVLAGTMGPVSDEWNLHKYVIVFMPNATWDDAEGDVTGTLNSNYHLATITCQAEQDFVASFLDESGVVQQWWLGGYQDPLDTEIPDANWTWVTGEPWNYTNWGDGEPNDYQGPASEQYLTIWDAASWGWNDEHNLGAVHGYIAEITPMQIQIDIRPFTPHNHVNINSTGVIPVAVLGSPCLDVFDIDQCTVEFQGASPQPFRIWGVLGAPNDVNGDGCMDMVFQFPAQEVDLHVGHMCGTLIGYLNDGLPIIGGDMMHVLEHPLAKNGTGAELPTDYNLAPNTPNPFNPSTRITYSLPEENHVSIEIFNIKGEKVKTLFNAWQQEGVHTIVWKGMNDVDQAAPGGVYFCRMISGQYTHTIRMLYLK